MKINLTDGREAEITATLVTERVIDANMDIREAVCETRWAVTISGAIQAWGYEGPVHIPAQTINNKPIVAKIGKLALTAEQYNECIAMSDKIEHSEYWIAWHRKLADNAAGVAAYEAHASAVDRMMTLNGRTY